MNWLVLRHGRLVLSRRRVMAVSGVAVFGDYLVYLTRRALAPHFRVFCGLFGAFRVPGAVMGQSIQAGGGCARRDVACAGSRAHDRGRAALRAAVNARKKTTDGVRAEEMAAASWNAAERGTPPGARAAIQRMKDKCD